MNPISDRLEFPKALRPVFKKAIRYEWISFFYMVSAACFSFAAMSNSQTMKTVWLEDLLGIVPPVSFLIASKIVRRKPNSNFPYGFHKVTSLSFLASSLALAVLGLYLLIDGCIVLIKEEHPSISSFQLGNHTIWFGYLMMLALLWSSIPSTVLGHIKIRLAKELYDKILFADSKMNKASWMSGFASIFGILGIGLGWWWADASVGILISLSIIYDGFQNLKQALFDLLDEVPKALGSNETDPLLNEIKTLLKKEEWIKSTKLRLRDDGHVFFGEIFIIVDKQSIDVRTLLHLKEAIQALHWRLHDLVIMPIFEAKRRYLNDLSRCE